MDLHRPGKPVRGTQALLLARMADSPAHDPGGRVHIFSVTAFGRERAIRALRRNRLPAWWILRFAGAASGRHLLRRLAASGAVLRLESLRGH